MGILDSSVKRPHRSSAEAWSSADTSTALPVTIGPFFSSFPSCFFGSTLAVEAGGAGVYEAGVDAPEPPGVVPSGAPCTSRSAGRSSLNLADRTSGKDFLTIASTAVAASDASEVSANVY